MGLSIVVHPTCAVSHGVLKHLAAQKLLDSVDVVVADTPSVVFRGGVWSVPWVTVDGVPAATDPVTPGEVEEMITTGRIVFDRNPVEAFMEAILHSSLASSLVAVWKSLTPVLDESLASAAVRTPFTSIDPDKVLEQVEKESDRLYREWIDKIHRALGVSFVRELWWSTGGSITAEEVAGAATPATVGAWLLAKASIGRIGLPANPLGAVAESARAVADFVSRNARGLLGKVRREQEEILGDREYWETIARLKSVGRGSRG